MNKTSGTESGPLYELVGVSKEYEGPGEKVRVLDNVNFSIERGQTLAVIGASGCGKSTLLHILGSLATPTSGQVMFQGKNIATLPDDRKAALRNSSIGFVFQFHHLLPEFTALENVAMPAMVGGMSRGKALEKAQSALEIVGLKARGNFRVTYLSGGERQRTAIARALLNNPKAILADEPTGNLDEKNGEMIAELLMAINSEHKTTVVVVTHNLELANRMEKCFELKAGDLYEQTR